MPSPPPASPADASACIAALRPASGPPNASTGAPVTAAKGRASGE
jgi:hypothetical protein